MEILVDSNILVFAANSLSLSHQHSLNAPIYLRQRGEIPCVTAQNLIEFWAVIDPATLGPPVSPVTP
jgi:hypothetical protein